MHASADPADRTVRRALDAIRRVVRRHDLWRHGDLLLLACSGGLDSMTALALLDRLRPSLGHNLAVAHVDHGLRAAADRDSALVTSAATARGLAVHLTRLALEAGPDLQGRARTARYDALTATARAVGCARIVTAHHANDQAETLIMHLARGAGPGALAGIRRFRDDGVVRPLLELDRATLVACALGLGVRWIDDPSNADRRHLRNRLRHEALPVLEMARPGAAAGLARSAANLEGVGDALDYWLVRALRDVWLPSDSDTLALPRSAVPADFFALTALLGFVARRLGCPPASRRAAEQVHATLTTCQRGSCRLRGIDVQISSDQVDFARRNVARPGGAD